MRISARGAEVGVLEICAVVLALIYVILAIFQRRLCWIAAIASASLYIVIFWQVQLLSLIHI